MSIKTLESIKKQYDALPLEEKVRRLEIIAAHYAKLLSFRDSKEIFKEDVIEHWSDFEPSS